jgi:hypothetical protein
MEKPLGVIRLADVAACRIRAWLHPNGSDAGSLRLALWHRENDMKRIGIATALVALGSASALAADLPLRSPFAANAPMMAPVANWSGLYLGGNIGYGGTVGIWLPLPSPRLSFPVLS